MSGNFEHDISNDAVKLLDMLEKIQWTYKPNFDYISKYKVITREDLRNTKMERGLFTTSTSGSTGEPVKVEKYYLDYLWYVVANIREFRWRKWDVTKNIAVIRPQNKHITNSSWGIPYQIEPIQGKKYNFSYRPISEIQKWLEDVNPHYIHVAPSIAVELDFSKLSNYIDHKGTNEKGGSCYSSEECGVIALQCPDNKNNWHVMENIVIETEPDGAAIITVQTHPYIKRYKHGDYLELGQCDCGRTLQTITNIHGRVRNMFIMDNGDKKWPLFGSLKYGDYGIKRFKAIQTGYHEMELQVISDPLGDKEIEIERLVNDLLGVEIKLTIKYVDSFPNYKFEEFVSLIS